jgi:uncharacterized protein (DUF433 family)
MAKRSSKPELINTGREKRHVRRDTKGQVRDSTATHHERGTSQEYVRVDEHGVHRVAQTRVMLDSVVAAWQQGHSPETIRAQYPSLTLEQVCGAITWCLSHPDEVKAYMRQQDAVWDHWRGQFEREPNPLRDRLRKMKQSRQRQGKP